MSKTAADIAKELRKRADQFGDLLSDPPKPHPDAALMRDAAAKLDQAAAYVALAVKVEREECALIAENSNFWPKEGEEIAAEIREDRPTDRPSMREPKFVQFFSIGGLHCAEYDCGAGSNRFLVVNARDGSVEWRDTL